MEIRPIVDDNEFLALQALVVAMYKEIDPTITEFGASNTLHNFIKENDFTAIGLYKGAKLIGFTMGHFFAKKSFLFTGIYVMIRNNEWTKKLIDFSFACIKEKGYYFWLVDATNPNISSMMEKYGAMPKYTRYQGVL